MMKNPDKYNKMITDTAIFSHDKFQKLYRELNNGTRVKITKDENWIKKHGTNQADLAKFDYLDVPSDWQKSRWLGAKAAVDVLLGAVKKGKPLDEKFIEYASDVVHEEWLNRNRDRAEDQHKFSYEQLPEEVKEKDRIFVRAAIEIYFLQK
jgi:hypothetical protein